MCLGEDREAIKRKLAASYPNEKPGTIAAWPGVLLRFACGPALGDSLMVEVQDRSPQVERVLAARDD